MSSVSDIKLIRTDFFFFFFFFFFFVFPAGVKRRPKSTRVFIALMPIFTLHEVNMYKVLWFLVLMGLYHYIISGYLLDGSSKVFSPYGTIYNCYLLTG